MMRCFNLLPWRERRQRIRRRNALAALACGAVAGIGTMAGSELYLRHGIQDARQRNAEVSAAISLEEQSGAEREQLESRKAQLSALLDALETVRRRNEGARSWLAQLPKSVPEGLRFTLLHLSNEGWELQVAATRLDQATELLERMRAMPVVLDARIEQMQSGPDMSRQFKLAGRLKE